MNIFKKILQYLPFNKNCIYKRLDLIIKQNENLININENLENKISELSFKIVGIENIINKNYEESIYLLRNIDCENKKEVNKLFELMTEFRAEQENYKDQYRLMFLSLFKKEEESPQDAQKRFFMNLPKADDSFRLIQNIENYLLKALNKICMDNKINYFFFWGSLIGTIRHAGFIPWDDDIDLGMLRSDLDKFIDIIKDNKEYEVLINYDAYVLCKQIRFKYRDDKNPIFIDIFVFDYINSYEYVWEERKLGIKKEMHEELLNMADEHIRQFHELKYVNENTQLGQYLKNIFDKYVDKAFKDNILLKKSDYIVYSIENWQDRRAYINEFSDYFPTRLEKYEDGYYPVPANSEKILKQLYGDVYSLPNGKKHFEHLNINEDLIEYLERKFVNGKNTL